MTRKESEWSGHRRVSRGRRLGDSDSPRPPLAVDFPLPARATRPSEKGTWAGVSAGPSVPTDAFKAIPGARDDPLPSDRASREQRIKSC